jgi:flavin reductase (DIM6/NTAB) family NADH-FMN oxidoreductase RutF
MISTVEFTEAVSGFATGVVLVTVRDGRDDIGTTVTAFASVSLEPPLVTVCIGARSYLSEVLHRQDRWAATIVSSDQRALAGRFAAEGRPSARLLLASVPHHRGPHSGALIVEGGLAALECETRQRVPAGDHVLFVAEALAVDYADPAARALIRVGGRYR